MECHSLYCHLVCLAAVRSGVESGVQLCFGIQFPYIHTQCAYLPATSQLWDGFTWWWAHLQAWVGGWIWTFLGRLNTDILHQAPQLRKAQIGPIRSTTRGIHRQADCITPHVLGSPGLDTTQIQPSYYQIHCDLQTWSTQTEAVAELNTQTGRPAFYSTPRLLSFRNLHFRFFLLALRFLGHVALE
jgi:hypothetical protein